MHSVVLNEVCWFWVNNSEDEEQTLSKTKQKIQSLVSYFWLVWTLCSHNFFVLVSNPFLIITSCLLNALLQADNKPFNLQMVLSCGNQPLPSTPAPVSHYWGPLDLQVTGKPDLFYGTHTLLYQSATLSMCMLTALWLNDRSMATFRFSSQLLSISRAKETFSSVTDMTGKIQ